jgi:plastocyanin
MKRGSKLAIMLLLCLCAAGVWAETATVRGRVEVAADAAQDSTQDANRKDGKTTKAKRADAKSKHAIPATVVWLTPAPGSGVVLEPPKADEGGNLRLVQRNKTFEPRILVVPAGSMVEFPNRDPFFHNVFSLFEGKRFDLGLYEAGTTRMVRFDRPGISYIFCNIHPEMSAVIITVATPLYAIASDEGQVNIAGVPYGRYLMHTWTEGMGPENVKPMTREITIGDGATSLGVIRVSETNGQRMAHKNKYGREYDEPSSSDSSVYQRQR